MQKVIFLNSDWTILVIIVTAVVWLFFLWKEYGQAFKIEFWTRAIIALISVSSIAMLALKPAIKTPSETKKIVILASNYEQNQLDSLKKKYRTIHVQNYNPNTVMFKEDTKDSVFVLGEGLEPYDFWQLSNHPVRYIPSKTPKGICKYTYNFENIVGGSLYFKGEYHQPKEGNYLILKGVGEKVLDSVALIAGKTQTIHLTSNHKSKGRFVYSLIEKDKKGNVISKSSIPFLVREKSNLTALILNNFPTFETKYLKNYLAKMGHRVLVKSQLTKGKFKYEYLNMPSLQLKRLDQKNLKPFDLLIIDATSFKYMSKTSRDVLENAMRVNGLGVFIQSDNNYFRYSLHPGTFNFVRDKISTVKVTEVPSEVLSKYSFYFKDNFGIEKIHNAADGKIISGYKHIGKGRIGTTTLTDTYELLLNGNTKTYSKIWSDILSKISTKNMQNTSWEPDGIIANINEPYQFLFRSNTKKPMVEHNDSCCISVAEDFDISGNWKGTTYPVKYGWNVLKLKSDSITSLSYFVKDKQEWKSKEAYDRIIANQKKFNQNQKNIVDPFYNKLISPIWFFSMFLLGMGYLWFKPKIRR